MRKITFLWYFLFFFGITNFVYAQYGCDSGVPISDGYTVFGVTSPGDGGEEDWNSPNPSAINMCTNSSGNALSPSYFDDDVYLFVYTSGSTDEEISITIDSHTTWTGLGIFSTCTGTFLDDCLGSSGSTSGGVLTASTIIGANQTVYIGIGQWGTPNAVNFDVTDFSVTQIACLPPSFASLESSSLTDSSVEFTWDDTGASNGYEWIVVAEGDGPEGATVDSGSEAFGDVTASITGLDANTSYDFYFRADCDTDGFSTWVGPFSFTTDCSSFLPYYDADMSSNPPDCWNEATSGDLATGPMEFGSGSWYSSNHNGTPSNAINLYFNNKSDWIVSPVFDLSTSAPSELNIYVALTESSTSGADASLGSDDQVVLLITNDGGSTWTPLQTWAQGTEPTDVGASYTFDLTAETGLVQFAFWGSEGAVNDPEDIYFHVSQFEVREIPLCEGAVASGEVIPDCVNNQFFIDVDVTTLGDAVSIFDGTDSFAISGTGITQVGPYDSGEEIVLSMVHSDSACDYDLDTFEYLCPVQNDECSDAVSLTVNPDYDCAVVTNGTILGATDSGVDNCGGTPDDDVWYSFVATDEVHMVSLINVSGSTVDMYHAIYDGSSGCGSLGEPLVCNDGNSSELDGLTPGNTYYVQVFTWTATGGQTSVFDICVGTLPCLEGEATGTIVSDCDNTQFSIDVEVTNQEDITDLTDGTTTIEVTGEGIYSFGPYASGTTVNIEALHVDDYCDFEVDEFYFQCPEEIICGNTLSETYCYENNESVVFYYTSSDGVSPLLIEFSQGTLEYDSWWGDTFDDLVIYDGSDNSGIVLFNSDIDGDDLTGLSFQANSGSIYMEFESDGTGSCGEGTETSWAYDISCVSCVPADVIAGVVPNCDSDEFFVEIGIATVDDFGDLVTLTDGAGQSETVSTSQPLYIFGPYPNGTEVTITAEHSDAACDFEVGTWEYYCPPANDACDGAELLTVGPSIDAYPVDGTVLGATEDAEPNDCGLNGPGVWYAVVVPANGSVNIETATDSNGTTGFDSVIEAFSGSCGSLTSIDCDDDGAATGNYSLLELNDLTPGETIYVRVWEYGGNETEPFSISAYNETLSTQDFDTQELFSYYPNPVENSLTIKAQQAIELVEVYNMLGQMVANETPNNMEGTIDMSTLTAGAYFVKVTFGNSSETIRIVKK